MSRSPSRRLAERARGCGRAGGPSRWRSRLGPDPGARRRRRWSGRAGDAGTRRQAGGLASQWGRVAGGATAVRYVIPTPRASSWPPVASRNAGPGTLGQCERALSTLRLPAATACRSPTVVESQQRWEAAVARLSGQRAGARRALATAERPAGQLLAAEALGRVHERAATRFAALPGGADVAAASRRTAAAYGPWRVPRADDSASAGMPRVRASAAARPPCAARSPRR